MEYKIESSLGYALLIILFGAIAFLILNDYNAILSKKTTEKVVMKESKKGLYSGSDYYFYIISEDTGLSKLSVGRDQFFNVDEYDNISGYKMGSSFHKGKGIAKNNTWGIIFLIISIVFILIGVLGLVSMFSKWSFWRGLKNHWPRLSIFKYILAILVIAAIFYAGKFAIHFYQEAVADEHVDAVITNKDTDFFGRGYRSIAHITYKLSLQFHDQDGEEIEVTKKVFKKTYDQYEEDDKIAITYQDGKPYDIFLPEQSIVDWFYFTPNMLYIYLLLGFVIYIIASIVKSRIKDKREQESQAGARYTANSFQDNDSSFDQDNANNEHISLEEWEQAHDLIKEYEENPDKADIRTAKVEQAYDIVEGRKNVKDEINLAYLWKTFWKCGIFSSLFILFFILIKEFTFIWVIVLFTFLFPFSKLVFDRLIGFRMRRKINLSPKWRRSTKIDDLYFFINVCLFFLSPLLAPVGVLYLLIRNVVSHLRK